MADKTELGVTVRDRITGFKGVATGRVEYITGCNQVLVAPKVRDDGSLVDTQWFDEERIEVIPAKSKPNWLTSGLQRLSAGPDKPAPRR